jgi:hypothetical protein
VSLFSTIVAGLGKGIGAVAAPVMDYLKTSRELRSKERLRKLELDDAIHARKVEAVRQGLAADVDWEMEFARQAASSWKDEFELIVVCIPLVMCWVPGLQDNALTGFAVLAQTPVWFQGLVLTIFLANYGIRHYRRKQHADA